MSYSTACTSLGAYTSDACSDNAALAQIGYVAIAELGSAWDYTDASAWNALIAAGTVKVIAVVDGNKPEAEQIQQPGKAFAPQRTVNQRHTVNFSDNNYIQNIDFYNDLRRANGTHRLLYVIRGYVFDSENACYFNVRDILETGAEVKANVSAIWESLDSPPAYTKPTGLFE